MPSHADGDDTLMKQVLILVLIHIPDHLQRLRLLQVRLLLLGALVKVYPEKGPEQGLHAAQQESQDQNAQICEQQKPNSKQEFKSRVTLFCYFQPKVNPIILRIALKDWSQKHPTEAQKATRMTNPFSKSN